MHEWIMRIWRIVSRAGLVIGPILWFINGVLTTKDILSFGLESWEWQTIGGLVYFGSCLAVLHSQQSEIESLRPKLIAILRKYIQGHWVHIQVTNEGETDDFVAQVVAGTLSALDEKPTIPFSLKWRQSDSEQRQIIGGQSQLLDFAELFVHQGFLQEADHPRGRHYYFGIQSTTAVVEVGTALTHREAESKGELVPVVSDEDIKLTASLLIEVRGAAHGAIGRAWVHLGFKLDKTPIATLSPPDKAMPFPLPTS